MPQNRWPKFSVSRQRGRIAGFISPGVLKSDGIHPVRDVGDPKPFEGLEDCLVLLERIGPGGTRRGWDHPFFARLPGASRPGLLGLGQSEDRTCGHRQRRKSEPATTSKSGHEQTGDFYGA